RIIILSAGAPLRDIGFPDRLIFGRQRRLLPATRRLARIVLAASARPHPLAFPVGKFRALLRPSTRAGRAQRRYECDRRQRNPVRHGRPPSCSETCFVGTKLYRLRVCMEGLVCSKPRRPPLHTPPMVRIATLP